jgi:hypothetical protein
MNKDTQWTTELLVPQQVRERYSFPGDLHLAWFIPKGWRRQGPAVDLGIPECELVWCAHYDPNRTT